MGLLLTHGAFRWLDGSGIWSCRIKIPQSQPDPSRALEQNPQSNESSSHMAPPTAMDVALENGSPSSRRNKGKIAEAIQSMSNLNASMEALDLPTDPDAQATVTDFLDFTEYLPADMIRSREAPQRDIGEPRAGRDSADAGTCGGKSHGRK